MDELTRTMRRAAAMQAVMLFGDDRDKAALGGLLAGEVDDEDARVMRARLDVIADRLLGS